MTSPPLGDGLSSGRPLLFQNATVLSMDPTIGVVDGGDVLVRGERIEHVGRDLPVPDDALVVDATDGILMPGMVDTHRHMWQTALRGFGADWTLSQYFVFYYLTWGKIFRPQDIHAGNLLAAIEAVDAGVTTTVDWSHGLQTPEHGDAAVEALRSVPGRFVLAYGNLLGAPWEWANSPAFRAFVDRHFRTQDDMLGLQLAFDVTGDAAFPERGAFEAARELDLPVTTHAGVWGATGDDGIRLMWEHDFMTPRVTYVHAATLSADSYQRIAASGGTVSISTESEQSAGQGYPPSWLLRKYGIAGVAVHGHQRVVERRPVLGDALHPVGRPVAGTSRGALGEGDRGPPRSAGRAGSGVGDDGRCPRTRPGRPHRLAHARASRPTSC